MAYGLCYHIIAYMPMIYHYSIYLAYIQQCTSIDPWHALNPPTPKLADIDAYHILLHHILYIDLYIYRTMHIYPWQIDPPVPHLSIDPLNTTTLNLADVPPVNSA